MVFGHFVEVKIKEEEGVIEIGAGSEVGIRGGVGARGAWLQMRLHVSRKLVGWATFVWCGAA